MTDREAYLALNLLPKIGPARVARLLEVFGSPTAILSAKSSALRAVPGFGEETTRALVAWESTVDLTREQRRIREVSASIITIQDDIYPPHLRESPSPPLVLYVLGQLQERDRHAISIVGSRRTSHYGLHCGKKLAFQLAHAGLTIVSGLARGIDTAAHEAALAAGGRTVAVLGSGLGKLYPAENLSLAEKIAAGQGAIVTEFPVDYPPDKQSFPQRNRIVAGWGHGVLVVEAPLRSGSLITANQAADAGRTVYAIPGPIDRPTAEGSNDLLKNGARLTTGASDILDDLSALIPAGTSSLPEPQKKPTPTLSPDENLIYEALGDEETSIDSLIERTGLTTSLVSSTLLRLEMKRLLKRLPGQRFVKLV